MLSANLETDSPTLCLNDVYQPYHEIFLITKPPNLRKEKELTVKKSSEMNYDCIFIIFIFLFCIVHGKDLVYVQTIWRHGDRAPEQLPYPNDQYVEDYWPRGWAQLTNVGMGQLHELGTFFKNRYVRTFVNSSFNYKEVIIFFKIQK